MAHLALDRALPTNWIDEVFQTHRQRQYPRELLFSSVVELMLPVSLAALYAQVQRTEPVVLRVLVQGSAEHLLRLAKRMNPRQQTQNRPSERLRRPSPRSLARTSPLHASSNRPQGKDLERDGINAP